MDTATMHEILRARQSHAGAWAFGASQDAVEPTCLAILALRHQPSAHLERALDNIENLQNKDGSWQNENAGSSVASTAPAGADRAIYRTALCTLMLEVYYRYLQVGDRNERSPFER